MAKASMIFQRNVEEITKTDKVQVYYYQRKQSNEKKLLEKNSDITQ